MSEYIVAGAEPNNTVLKSITKNGYEHEMWLPVREEIVRCRDCKWFTPEQTWAEDRGFGMVEFFTDPPDCGNPERCSHHYDSFKNETVPVHIVTDPNGFCAWACRKEQ